MYDFDEFDDEYDEDDLDDLLDEEDEMLEREDELLEKEDEFMEHEEELREAVEDLHGEFRDEIEDLEDERHDIESMRHELDEIRRMKEQLRREIEDVRREKDVRKIGRRTHRIVRPVRPSPPPKAPQAPRRAAIVDFEALTDSLEEMMDGLGDQIRMSVSGLKDVGRDFADPFREIKTTSRRIKHGKKGSKSKIDKISPERVASVIIPLASEERLKILDYLKGGGRTFNELETHIGKTGSSLTHHLNPLLEAGYVIKGEVRGTYYLTVEGRLAYRLAQWLTDRLEREIRLKDVKEEKLKKFQGEKDGEVEVIVEDIEEDE
ncbi:MAG: ArsR family transcriptional regulator [Candidatus Thorarchaeota archaeon]